MKVHKYEMNRMTTSFMASLGYGEAAPSVAVDNNEGVEVAWSAPTTSDIGNEEQATPTDTDLGYGTEATPTAADLGYAEETTPTAADLGYGEEDELTAGYGQPAPSRGLRHTGHHSSVAVAWNKRMESPAGATGSLDLGYGEAAPSRSLGDSHHSASVSIESKEARGYELAAARSSRGLRRMGHRASFGGGWRPDSSTTASRVSRRRVTMDHHAPVLSRPAHHTMAPRRSSLSGGACGGHHQKAPRRVSFGGSDAINHVSKCNPQDKRDIWYDTQELNQIRRKLREVICHERELNEDEDCWRGLEVYIKKHEDRLSRISGQEASCNQIMLELQKLKLAASKESRDETTMRMDHLQFSAGLLRESATRLGNNQAAKDALEALDIYMEDMDAEKVRACFPTPPVE